MWLRFIFLVLPTKLLSRMTGELTEWRAPKWLLDPVIEFFVKSFEIDMEEADMPDHGFATFQEFFARPLKNGRRPISDEGGILASPCDGALGASGTIEDGQALQIKGRPYSIAELLGDEAEAKRFEGGQYVTIYLSPRDYHRFHSPDDLLIRRLQYIPGKLWPVFPKMLRYADVFCENERVIAYGSHADYDIALIPVGAYNVGRMRIHFSDLQNEHKGRVYNQIFEEEIQLERGAEWGYFGFGSTIVMLIQSKKDIEYELTGDVGDSIKLGQKLLVLEPE